MNVTKRAWLTWFVVAVGWFGVLEYKALRNKVRNDTLTQTLHYSIPAWLLFTVLSGFFGWFTHHMMVTYQKRRGGK